MMAKYVLCISAVLALSVPSSGWAQSQAVATANEESTPLSELVVPAPNKNMVLLPAKPCKDGNRPEDKECVAIVERAIKQLYPERFKQLGKNCLLTQMSDSSAKLKWTIDPRWGPPPDVMSQSWKNMCDAYDSLEKEEKLAQKQ